MEVNSISSYVEPKIPNKICFEQRKPHDKPKKVLEYSLENCSEMSKIDVCLRIKPRTNSVPTEVNK